MQLSLLRAILGIKMSDLIMYFNKANIIIIDINIEESPVITIEELAQFINYMEKTELSSVKRMFAHLLEVKPDLVALTSILYPDKVWLDKEPTVITVTPMAARSPEEENEQLANLFKQPFTAQVIYDRASLGLVDNPKDPGAMSKQFGVMSVNTDNLPEDESSDEALFKRLGI